MVFKKALSRFWGLTPLSAQNAIDVVEIQQLLNLFAIAIDQHRYELLPNIFTPDVTANFYTPGGSILHGIDAVISDLKQVQHVPSAHDQSTNYVTVQGAQAAQSTTYVTATFFGAGKLKGQTYTNYGRYEDELIKTDVGWRIKKRRLISMGGTTGNLSIVFPDQ